MACDQQESAVRHSISSKNDDESKDINCEDAISRPSTYLISQSPHLPLGWSAPDLKEVLRSEVDLLRDSSTTSALNERFV